MKTVILSILLNFYLLTALVSAAPNHGHRHRHRRVTRTSRSNVSSTTSHNTAKLVPTYPSTPSIIVVQRAVDYDILFLRQNESKIIVTRSRDDRELNESSENHKAHRNGMEDLEGVWDGTIMGWTALGVFVGILVVA